MWTLRTGHCHGQTAWNVPAVASPNGPGDGAGSVQLLRSWAGQPRSLSHPITMLGGWVRSPARDLVQTGLGVNARVCNTSPRDAPDPGTPVPQ